MKRVILLAVACSALVIGASASFANINKNAEERDATIIVKMKTNVDNYSEAALINKQNALLAEISSNVTSNYKIKNRYSHIFNGFVLEIPSAYVAEVSNLSAVADVNYQNIVAQTTSFDDGFKYVINFNEKTIGKTASAQTMEKPSGTKEGSGTFIAILDNAFYIGYDENNNEFHHNVFSPLNDEDVFVTQATYSNIRGYARTSARIEGEDRGWNSDGTSMELAGDELAKYYLDKYTPAYLQGRKFTITCGLSFGF